MLIIPRRSENIYGESPKEVSDQLPIRDKGTYQENFHRPPVQYKK